MNEYEKQAKLRGVRDPGDAWVVAADGKKYWGKFGAAGLLLIDPKRGILLQHRVEWSDHGGTWGIPGGAINLGEETITGAIREAHEEAGVPYETVVPLYTHLLDRKGWTYTTVIALTETSFEPKISDPESLALEWVPIAEVSKLPLHPGFAASWEVLREIVETTETQQLQETQKQQETQNLALETLRKKGHNVSKI